MVPLGKPLHPRNGRAAATLHAAGKVRSAECLGGSQDLVLL